MISNCKNLPESIFASNKAMGQITTQTAPPPSPLPPKIPRHPWSSYLSASALTDSPRSHNRSSLLPYIRLRDEVLWEKRACHCPKCSVRRAYSNLYEPHNSCEAVDTIHILYVYTHTYYIHTYIYHILLSKCSWTLEIDGPNNGGMRFHRQAILYV